MKLTKFQILMLNFIISIGEAFLLVVIMGLTAGLTFIEFPWAGFLIAVFTLTQTLVITIKVAISSGEEPVVDPFGTKE